MTVQGTGSNQRYVGVQLAMDKKKEEFPKVPFECHRCAQMVDSEKGYFVEHYRVKMDRYGAPKRILCAASNNKVRADLRTLEVSGECTQCGTEAELKMTEEYPGGLLKYGGFLDIQCPVCDGRKHATCEECGQGLVEVETKDPTLGVTVSHWVHDSDNAPECNNGGVQWFVLDYDQTDANGQHVVIAGPFPDEATADQEQANLEQAITATGNENYGTDTATTPGTSAKAFALSIKQNPATTVRVHDGFTIEEWDDTDNSPSPFDSNDPLTAALMGNITAQEG